MTEREYEDAGSKSRTILIIVAIVAIGTPFVLWNYLKTIKNQQDENRPPIVTRLQKNFIFSDQNAKLVQLSDLEGTVWCYTGFTIDNFERYENTFSEMKRLAEKFSTHKDFRLIAITLNPETDTPERMKAFFEGKGYNLDQWLFLTAGGEKLRKYMKNYLKVDLIHQKQINGEKQWIFPSFIGLVDKNRHLRQRYDFEEARKEGVDRQADLLQVPELKENKEFMRRLRAEELLRERLQSNITHLFEEDLTKK